MIRPPFNVTMFNSVARIIGFALVLYNITSLVVISSAKRVRYISTEHPTILYYDKTYFKYVNLTSQRYGRSNPFYYVGFHMETVVTLNNTIDVSFYFYEFLTNVYKRGFVEMHFKLCDLIHKDTFFGAPLRQGKLSQTCPYPPDTYHAYNMSIDVRVIPPGFPFRKGRIYCNVTIAAHLIGSASIDMEVKEVNIKDKS